MGKGKPPDRTESSDLSRMLPSESLASILSLFFFVVALDLGYRNGSIIVDSYVFGAAVTFIGLIVLLTAIYVISLTRWKTAAVYLGIIIAFNYALSLAFLFHTGLAVILAISFALQIISLISILRKSDGNIPRTVVAVASLLVMLYLGNVLQLVQNRPDTGMVIESTASVFAALGQNLPLLERGGMFVLTDHFDFILSIQQFILFSVLASLIAENYYQIITLVRGKSKSAGTISLAAYSLTGALSCQCESYISVLPALSILLINYILLPVVGLSIILLIATYFLISRVYVPGRSLKFLTRLQTQWSKKYLVVLGAILLIISPFFLIAVVFYGGLSNAFFFFVSGMLMILVGYIFTLLVSRVISIPIWAKRLDYALGLIGSFILFAWFYPPLTSLAYSIPYVFAVMNISMLAAGISFGIVYLHNIGKWGDILNEYLSTALGIFSLVLFYILATFQVKIWPIFSFQSQLLFALYGWVAMVPLMWITTQISLNRLAKERGYST